MRVGHIMTGQSYAPVVPAGAAAAGGPHGRVWGWARSPRRKQKMRLVCILECWGFVLLGNRTVASQNTQTNQYAIGHFEQMTYRASLSLLAPRTFSQQEAVQSIVEPPTSGWVILTMTISSELIFYHAWQSPRTFLVQVRWCSRTTRQKETAFLQKDPRPSSICSFLN